MAQAEDTELRDLVIEALEKNGSLAKIRALLRANIFLAFEDECDNMKQNANLDNILKLPEGVLALSIVHEFLEFCNLKNTLFVYMSESRQGRDYTYEGRKMLADKLHFINGSHDLKEPVLVTFVKNIIRPYQRKYYEEGDGTHDKLDAPFNHHKDDENCTYIVHEDSTTSTSSNSDNSSDEKNKLHFKLPLDHSDTDTSSDSTREKSSEYIPNQHILSHGNPEPELSLDQQSKGFTQKESHLTSQNSANSPFLQELKMTNSSDSTSYADIKSYLPTNQKNPSVPSIKVDDKTESARNTTNVDLQPQDPIFKADTVSSATLNSISSISLKNNNVEEKIQRNQSIKFIDEPTKSDTEATEYSLDFTSSPASKNKLALDRYLKSPEHIENTSLIDKTSHLESPRQNSQSSQSSVSISDVADLIEYSDKNIFEHSSNKENLRSDKSKNESSNHNKPPSEDSGDFSDSPIPSLSNLSLDIHSD